MGGDEFDPEDDDEVEADHFYGLFQWFMPTGAGVERVFEPIPDGQRFLDRIRPIYEMLNPEDFAGEYVPGYFNGGNEDAPQDTLRSLGEELIERLKLLFSKVPEDDEAADAAKEAFRALSCTDEEDSEVVYEALGDLLRSRSDYNEKIELLSEAYYSIACDYWVAYYLQWPRYQGLQEAEDCLYPYFELYRYGYNLHWTQNKLFIGRRS
ncbi:unnamed protein product [Penicillium discolor]